MLDPADGEKSLLPTSPRPCGSAANLGDNWLDSFSPDGWEVLARMENNLSGVGMLLAGAFWIKQSLCREVAEPQWPLQDLGLSSGLGTAWGQVCGSCGMGSAPPSCSLCCQNTRIWPAGEQEHQSSTLFAWFESCECAVLGLWGTHCPPRGFGRLDFTEEEEKGWNCL